MNELDPLFHELANLFPLIEGLAFDELCEDIKTQGQLEPIVFYEGKILDGRNRWRACQTLGLEPRTTVYEGSEPFSFVVSLNLHRRHLSSSQRAALAVSFEEYFAREAKERQREGGKNKVSQNVDYPLDPNENKAAAQAAKLLGTNRTYVAMAKKLQQISPDTFEDVKSGRVSIHKAIKQARKTHQHTPDLPSSQYQVLYIDPPWRFYGIIPAAMLAEAEYPTMTDDELVEFGTKVNEIAPDDAVIFMWTTNIKLPMAIELLKEWGFTHRGQIVWVKTRSAANATDWLHLRHEILLIGSRGNLIPMETPPSVIEADTLRHSQKPAVFRQWIERMFPNHKRIELFARQPSDDWSVWGNEV